LTPQDHFAALLCEALAPAAPPVAGANMRALCDFAHMVYDVAAQSSTLDANVRFSRFSLCCKLGLPPACSYYPSATL
jgi:hypothetical protein